MKIEELAKVTTQAAEIVKRCKALEQSHADMQQRLTIANAELAKTKERLNRSLKKIGGKAINPDDEFLLFRSRTRLTFTGHLDGSRALKVWGPFLKTTYSAVRKDKRSLVTEALKDLRKRGWK